MSEARPEVIVRFEAPMGQRRATGGSIVVFKCVDCAMPVLRTGARHRRCEDCAALFRSRSRRRVQVVGAI